MIRFFWTSGGPSCASRLAFPVLCLSPRDGSHFLCPARPDSLSLKLCLRQQNPFYRGIEMDLAQKILAAIPMEGQRVQRSSADQSALDIGPRLHAPRPVLDEQHVGMRLIETDSIAPCGLNRVAEEKVEWY